MIKARKCDVLENYHGTMVPDPYRWLEDPDSGETKAWSEYQNNLSHEYFKKIATREDYEKGLTKIWGYTETNVPTRKNNYLFYTKKDGLENQPKLYIENDSGESKVVIDPNKFSDNGTIALTNYSISKDCNLIAYATSVNGSDWQEIRFRNLHTGEDLEDVIKWCRFTNIVWSKEDKGVYYGRFPEPGTVNPEDSSNYNRIYWHKVGTPQEDDLLIYEEPENKEFGFYPHVTEDEKYITLHVGHGTSTKNRFYYKEIDREGQFIKLLNEGDAQYNFIANNGTKFYFKTDYKASRGRVIEIDINNPSKDNWRELVPEANDSINSVSYINHSFVINYMEDAKHKIKVYKENGDFDQDIKLPMIGSVTQITGKANMTQMYIGVSSFLSPESVYLYDFESGELKAISESKINYDASNYETNQVFFTSKDGTRIPMFLVHKKGLVLDGNNPVLLYGYGGFNASITPFFNPAILPWLEVGGIYAVVNLRGGSEYGDEWHRAGMLEKKQNVFDDFIGAAEWLIKNNYTKSEKLAIMGRSNGGLLVSACMVQRPELYGAVICNVPVTDMLRYHKFTVGRYWIPEYGNGESDPEHFKFLYAYSPLHNVKKGIKYPPILIATADTDDRVVPAHAKKLTATLLEATEGGSTVLLRLEKGAGHGFGKPTSKLIAEWADFFAFLTKELNI